MQIIQVNLTSEGLQPITSGTKVEFTYSVTWTPSPIHFSRRFEKYLDYNFFEHQVPIRDPTLMSRLVPLHCLASLMCGSSSLLQRKMETCS